MHHKTHAQRTPLASSPATSELTMHHHINIVVRSCFFHLRCLKSVRRILGAEVTSGLVSAFVTTRLYYCNSVLAGFHNLQLIHFNVSRMPQPDLLQEKELGTTSLQSSRAYTGFRSSSASSTSALRAHAPGASWSQSCVPVGHDDIRGWPAWP